MSLTSCPDVSVLSSTSIQVGLAVSKMTGFLFVLSSLPLHQLTQDENDTENVDERTSEETILMRKPEDETIDVNLCSERYSVCT